MNFENLNFWQLFHHSIATFGQLNLSNAKNEMIEILVENREPTS